MQTLTNDMQRWRDICYTKNALSEEQITALATASEQTFRQIASDHNDENVVFLYKSTSVGLKNLDEDKHGHGHGHLETSRKVDKSNYVARSTLSPQRPDIMDSIISPSKSEVDIHNVPFGFPPSPEKVPDKFEGKNEEQYKDWMRKK
jgi:hypothetical protein